MLSFCSQGRISQGRSLAFSGPGFCLRFPRVRSVEARKFTDDQSKFYGLQAGRFFRFAIFFILFLFLFFKKTPVSGGGGRAGVGLVPAQGAFSRRSQGRFDPEMATNITTQGLTPSRETPWDSLLVTAIFGPGFTVLVGSFSF